MRSRQKQMATHQSQIADGEAAVLYCPIIPSFQHSIIPPFRHSPAPSSRPGGGLCETKPILRRPLARNKANWQGLPAGNWEPIVRNKANWPRAR